MLKIGKGLHKKKKSKKNKHKEEELFTEEELDQYRKEHREKSAEGAENQSEEFEKFKALTAGVDDILRKSQGDLDRIKKESFFQRKPTPSEVKAQEERKRQESKVDRGDWTGFKEPSQGVSTKQGEECEQEGEEEEERASDFDFDDDDINDDIFDTAYVDALESGQVKLAYVSEDDEITDAGEPDPFDTTSAEEILRKVQAEEEKKKRQISLGAAVQVLTGRAERDKSLLAETGAAEAFEAVTPATKPKKRPRKIQDVVLIGSFDEEAPQPVKQEVTQVAQPLATLLDNEINVEGELPEGDDLLHEVLANQAASRAESSSEKQGKNPDESNKEKGGSPRHLKEVVSEFDAIAERVTQEVRKAEEVDSQFDEFTALAASSVANQKLEEELRKFEDIENDPFDTSTANLVLREQSDPFGLIDSVVPPPQVGQLSFSNQKWSAFDSGENRRDSDKDAEEDPFDTTFVEKIQPGKCELRLLESEILGDIVEAAHKSDVHQEARILSRKNSESEAVDARSPDESLKNQKFYSQVSIRITNPGSGSESAKEEVTSRSNESKDLLGGSATDLSALENVPLPPEVGSPSEDFSKYSDPFDTSIVDQVAVPGKAELKFIEKELLSDIPRAEEKDSLSDEDFDPRKQERSSGRKISFDVPSPLIEGISPSTRDQGVRPLTPYRLDENESESHVAEFDDPFETAHLTVLPGKEELKIIENELNSLEITETVSEPLFKKLGIVEDARGSQGLTHSLSAEDFNAGPDSGRDDKEDQGSVITRRLSDVSALAKKPPTPLKIIQAEPDLLFVDEEFSAKPLTPRFEEDFLTYTDPFDTSIAENILPGKAELKVIESELIETTFSEGSIKRSYTDPNFDPRDEVSRKEGSGSSASDILNASAPESSESVIAKPLSPIDFEGASDADFDPFDTAIAANLVPGKAEIKVLESELLGQ